MGLSEIIMLLSGVALFLFGMSTMGDGLKKASGNKLEPILFKLTNTMPRGVLLGAGVTAVIQSSCATAVMVVGFVNSGMMKVRQGIYVILGSIIGTSVTGWVICLSYIEGAEGIAELISTATLTGIAALAGIIMKMFAKKQMTKSIGEIFLGFAVLMFGMSTMSGSVSSLGEQEWFTNALMSMSNPAAGILAGTLFTALLQSASAAVGIIQALSMTGAMTFDAAFPLLMGVNIGAAVPVVLSAVGATVAGKRTAFVYPIASGLGVVFLSAVFYIANALVNFGFMSMVMNPFSLALVNTIIRLVMILLLLPITDFIEIAVSAIAREKNEADEPQSVNSLEERFISYPALAIEQSRMTINEMARLSQKAVLKSFELFTSYSEETFAKVRELENTVDSYEDALGTYLVKLTGQEMNDKQNESVSIFLHTLSEFESISDLAMSLALKAKSVHEKEYEFTNSAKHELDTMCKAVTEVLRITNKAFTDRNTNMAKQIEPFEEYIDDLRDEIKQNYIVRLQKEECSLDKGIAFNDIITNCERISDHCSNIAVAMIELGDDSFETHEYLNNLREKHNPEFKRKYNQYKEKFSL